MKIEGGALVVGRWYVVPFFRWFDLWVGAYWDRNQRLLYVCPLPTVGVYIGRADLPNACDECGVKTDDTFGGLCADCDQLAEIENEGPR